MTHEHRPDPDRTPTLGSIDDLEFADRARPASPHPPSAPPPRRPRTGRTGLWLLLAGFAAVAIAGGWALSHWRETLGEQLIPVSDLNQQIREAEAALARGDLSAADGSGARERFQAVLARDPDHPGARRGLGAVRDAALAQARAALVAGDLATARTRIELARAMAAPAADLALLDVELRRAESTGDEIADLLERARAAQQAGRFEQVPDGALALYGDVLQRQPDNAIAIEGRRVILGALLTRAQAALEAGDLASAEALVARVVETDPTHLGLPAVRASLGEAVSQRERRREAGLADADAARRDGRLEDAAAAYLALLATDPGLVAARHGLDDAAAAIAARASRQAADFEFEAAESSLRLARTWDPDSPAIAVAEQRLADARASRDLLPPPEAAPRLGSLVRQAVTAMRRGDLIDPPGDSAWDRLRVAAAIAPDHPDVLMALDEYDRRARACFEDELAGNRLSRAQGCLDAMVVRDRRGDGMLRDRRRLAGRWLAFAEERLGAGELALARRAIDAAQSLDPGHPGLVVMEERLARASY